MNRLWAPWRKAYIKNKNSGPGCLFCRVRRAPRKKDPAHYVVYRSSHSFVILNRYPYNNGHLMVVPNRHLSRLEKLNAQERLDLLGTLDRSLKAIEKSLKPQGFNVGLNLGRAGGAGVVGHLHLHVVPRWVGDTNFMPVTAQTKVLSDSLKASYREIEKYFG